MLFQYADGSDDYFTMKDGTEGGVCATLTTKMMSNRNNLLGPPSKVRAPCNRFIRAKGRNTKGMIAHLQKTHGIGPPGEPLDAATFSKTPFGSRLKSSMKVAKKKYTFREKSARSWQRNIYPSACLMTHLLWRCSMNLVNKILLFFQEILWFKTQ